MEKVVLNVTSREKFGKQPNKKLRRQGSLPAVVYKKGKETLALNIDNKELFRALHTSAGGNVIITLHIKDDSKDAKSPKEKTVIIKEMQYHPLQDDVIHVDFHEISLTEAITVDVIVEPKGEPEGVKKDGGVLDHPLKQLRIQCLPTQIPGKIEVNVELLKIGDIIRVKDLLIPEGVKVINDPELTVLSVVPPHVEKPAEEAEAAATEPEVIREKKPEAEEAEGAAAEEKPQKAEKAQTQEKPEKK